MNPNDHLNVLHRKETKTHSSILSNKYKYFMAQYGGVDFENSLPFALVSEIYASIRFQHRRCIRYCTAVIFCVKHWRKMEWDDNDIEQVMYRDIYGNWIESNDPYDTIMVTEAEAADLIDEEYEYYNERLGLNPNINIPLVS